MTYHSTNAVMAHQILAFINPELKQATCEKDLKRRLARLGFCYRDTSNGRMLTTVPQGVDVALIPARYLPLSTP